MKPVVVTVPSITKVMRVGSRLRGNHHRDASGCRKRCREGDSDGGVIDVHGYRAPLVNMPGRVFHPITIAAVATCKPTHATGSRPCAVSREILPCCSVSGTRSRDIKRSNPALSKPVTRKTSSETVLLNRTRAQRIPSGAQSNVHTKAGYICADHTHFSLAKKRRTTEVVRTFRAFYLLL